MNKNFIFPKQLNKGDKVGIITPSGNIDPSFIDGAIVWLQNLGFDVVVSPHAYGQKGRFGGSVEERISDIQSMFDAPELSAILCSRGGYGAVHLLEKLDLTELKKHPKWIIGYSDITAIHQLLSKNGIVSLHAPMARHLTEDPNNAASQLLKEVLNGKPPKYHITPHQLNVEGECQGILIGGNLSVFTSLLGSEYIDVPENSILFIEDIGEKAYCIDRMMWNIKLAGVFDRISGIVIGQFADCPEDSKMYYDIYTSMYKMLKEYNIPIAFNFPVGHLSQNFPLIHGATHKLHVSNYGVFLNFADQ